MRRFILVAVMLASFVAVEPPAAGANEETRQADEQAIRAAAQQYIEALEKGDAETLRAVDHLALRSGNSEILNWIMTAGVVTHLTIDQNDYIPVRRTPAGTGIGLGFLTWVPEQDG